MNASPQCAAILTGGAGSRLGRDKASTPVGGVAMVEWVEAAARRAGLESIQARDDHGGNRGPLSGLLTVFETYPWDAFLALSCDMPLVPPDWLRTLSQTPLDERCWGVFTQEGPWVGFPFTLHRHALDTLRQLLGADRRSLQALRNAGPFQALIPPPRHRAALYNVNTVDDWERMEEFVRQSGARPPA